MLLDGVSGELKNTADSNMLMNFLSGNMEKEQIIHQAMTNPQFLVLSGGGPRLTDSHGVPWTAAYVNANSELSVDLRSDLASESWAKIVNAIGILVGLWGIAAFTSLSGAIVFNRIFAIVYAAGAILGLLPFTNTLFGMTFLAIISGSMPLLLRSLSTTDL